MCKQYLEILQHILDNGVQKGDRTGAGTISVFGYQSRYDLSKGFPLLTTKKMYTRAIFEELLWFLQGSTNIRPLVLKKVNIWNGDAFRGYRDGPDYNGETIEEYVELIKTDEDFAKKHGNLGPVYGKQWRDFGGVDQIQEVLNSLKNNPNSRRHIVTAWNPAQIKDVVLPPCHMFMQFYVANGKLSCHMYQRSADAFLGVPFNIASYAALTMMMAQVLGLEAGDFIHTFGDLHIYLNHVEQVKEQLTREPRALPKLVLNPDVKDLFSFTREDFTIEGYDPYPTIKAELNFG